MFDSLFLSAHDWIFVGILLVIVYGVGVVPRLVDRLVLGRDATR